MKCDRCAREGFRPVDMAAQMVAYVASPSAPLRAKRFTGKAICPRCVIDLEARPAGTQEALI